MITGYVLEPFSIFKKGAERFHAESMSPIQNPQTDLTPEEIRNLLIKLIIYAIIIFWAVKMAKNCKDKGLNYAFIISDPIAYIIGRSIFGKC